MVVGVEEGRGGWGQRQDRLRKRERDIDGGCVEGICEAGKSED